MIKNGLHKEKQRYRCLVCKKTFVLQDRSWIARVYHRYAFDRQILKNVTKEFHFSVKTLQRAFKEFPAITGQMKEIAEPVNLVFDATFFTKTDGV